MAALAPPPRHPPTWEAGIWFSLDRVTKSEQADQNLALALAAIQAGQQEPYYGNGGYGSLFPYGAGFCPPGNPNCGLGPSIVKAPTNTFNTLEQRGIRTAEDLFKESTSNSRIVRQLNFP